MKYFAREGDSVTLLVEPDEGYYLYSVKAKDYDTEEFLEQSDITIQGNTVTIIMPPGAGFFIPGGGAPNPDDDGAIFHLIP